jgi:hypothetical protein
MYRKSSDMGYKVLITRQVLLKGDKKCLKETCPERGIKELLCDLVINLISHQRMGKGQ